MRHPLTISALIVLLLTTAACDRTPVIDVTHQSGDPLKENMINANKYIANAEDTEIENYIRRHNWSMRTLANGERLQVYASGSGAFVGYEDSVTVRYRLEALNGSVFYDSQEETFVAGRHQTVVGLDHAVMQLRRGSKARLILPSALGYGVMGDGDRVPSRAVLIYDLEILTKTDKQ